MPLSSLNDKRNDTSQLQVKNEFISCRLFHFSFFKKNRYIHFCKKWRIASYDHILIYGYVYLIIFYKRNVINEPLHDHYFLSFSYLMKSSCWRKEHTNVRAKLSQDQNSSLQQRICTKLIYYYYLFLHRQYFLKVSHPTSSAFDLYWEKSKGEGDSKSILPRAPIVERNGQSIEVWETRIEHLPRKRGGYFSDNPIACSNEL